MTDRAYIDSSAIIALYDDQQEDHRAAVAWFEEHGDGSLIAHLAVISEVTALMDRRLGAAATDAFVDELLESIAVFHGTELVNVRAMAAYRAGRGRRRPSLTDCLSFETMRELELDVAFAFDDHFREAGFQTVA